MNVDIQKLEAFFKDRELPNTLKLSKWETVINTRKFVDTHITTIKALNGKDVVAPYVDRLRKFAMLIK